MVPLLTSQSVSKLFHWSCMLEVLRSNLPASSPSHSSLVNEDNTGSQRVNFWLGELIPLEMIEVYQTTSKINFWNPSWCLPNMLVLSGNILGRFAFNSQIQIWQKPKTKTQKQKQKQNFSWALPLLSILQHYFTFDTRRVGFSCIKQFSHTCNVTQFGHYLPGNSVRSHRIKGSVPQDWPNCDVNHKARSLLVLLTG